MNWRTVVITKRCKLDLKMGTMIVRSEDTKRILLDEISVIIIENSAVSITGCLLTELAKRKIFGVTFSRDNLINKLYAYLSSKTQMSENYERMLQINNAVSGFISSIGFDENLDIDFNSSVDLSLLFKSVDLRFSDDGKSLSEKLIDYITYIRELEGDKIFVFVNLLMFVSYEERELFFQTIIDHRFTVLLLEGTGVSVSGNVNQIIIDNDLCVI